MSDGTLRIRLATAADAAAISAIYAPYVVDTPITFETEVPSIDEMQSRIVKTLAGHPWLVCATDTDVVGYAYAGQYRSRAAYQWSVEVTVYVRADAHRRGIGRALYTSLLDLVTLQEFYNAFALITLPNASSVGLHQSLGFASAGVCPRVGFKLGQWLDVGTWARGLRPVAPPRAAPLPLAAIRNTPEWDRALAA